MFLKSEQFIILQNYDSGKFSNFLETFKNMYQKKIDLFLKMLQILQDFLNFLEIFSDKLKNISKIIGKLEIIKNS